MSHDMTICGMQVRRNSKLRTCLPVPDTSTSIPVTIINGKLLTSSNINMPSFK